MTSRRFQISTALRTEIEETSEEPPKLLFFVYIQSLKKWSRQNKHVRFQLNLPRWCLFVWKKLILRATVFTKSYGFTKEVWRALKRQLWVCFSNLYGALQTSSACIHKSHNSIYARKAWTISHQASHVGNWNVLNQSQQHVLFKKCSSVASSS